MTLDREGAWRVQARAMRDFLRWLGSASPGARVLELPGVTASIVPAVPGRSIVNGVVFATSERLSAALDRLEAAYRDAGIEAWTVWAPDFEREAVALLEDRGHAFDGEPLAMILDLAQLVAPAPGDLDWDFEATPAELGALNDVAYGNTDDARFAAAIGEAPEELRMRRYRAREAGELACVLATMDHGADTGVYFVATSPGHRGRGLASRLLGVALADARSRGQATASLQASALGAGVYRRLGFRDHFRMLMYERRG